jgi:hypothetical protein
MGMEFFITSLRRKKEMADGKPQSSLPIQNVTGVEHMQNVTGVEHRCSTDKGNMLPPLCGQISWQAVVMACPLLQINQHSKL